MTDEDLHEPTLEPRKAAVLRAIVSHYVGLGEPVGSKTIVEHFNLGVSPATVRNDMSALEDAGLIYQPHTSAGRVPTDIGYRYFVDAWARDVSLPTDDRRRIKRFFTEPRWELEDALRETASLLSRVTNHAAVVFAPALDRSIVRHVELVRLTGDRAMLILVTDSGRVENHVLHVDEDIDDVMLEQANEILNRLAVDAALDSAADIISEGVERFPLELRDSVATVVKALKEEMSQRGTERVFLEGAANIVDEAKFADLHTVRNIIGALEHRRIVLELLADALSQDMVVRIGSENSAQEMRFCSVIAAPYGAIGNPLGSLGVVGPTRMDYNRSIAAVHEVALALGRMLTDLGL
ncbi:MAG: heat-inducible transcriptional repressor HrcA [Actinomycetota bacterium]